MQTFRVSTKAVSVFVFWFYQCPGGRESPFWAFFNNPFCVDFKNSQFLIIWSNLEQDIAKLLRGGHFKSQNFFGYCWIKNLSNHKHACTLRRAPEYSRTLRTIKKYGSMVLRPGKSYKRCKRRLRTFCWKSRYFEDFLSQISRWMKEEELKMEKWGWIKQI